MTITRVWPAGCLSMLALTWLMLTISCIFAMLGLKTCHVCQRLALPKKANVASAADKQSSFSEEAEEEEDPEEIPEEIVGKNMRTDPFADDDLFSG